MWDDFFPLQFPLFCKLHKWLAHPMHSVRTRAMTNILFKLKHEIITLIDLVQQRDFIKGLLEWFNHPELSMEEEVLDLLEKLAKV